MSTSHLQNSAHPETTPRLRLIASGLPYLETGDLVLLGNELQALVAGLRQQRGVGRDLLLHVAVRLRHALRQRVALLQQPLLRQLRVHTHKQSKSLPPARTLERADVTALIWS